MGLGPTVPWAAMGQVRGDGAHCLSMQGVAASTATAGYLNFPALLRGGATTSPRHWMRKPRHRYPRGLRKHLQWACLIKHERVCTNTLLIRVCFKHSSKTANGDKNTRPMGSGGEAHGKGAVGQTREQIPMLTSRWPPGPFSECSCSLQQKTKEQRPQNITKPG